MARILTCALALALFTLGSSAELQAQHDPWTVSIEAEGGGYFPIRAFGKNAAGTEDPDLIVTQPGANGQSSAIAGVGVRVQLPHPNISLRLQGFQTFGGEVHSRTELCDVLSPGDVRREAYRCERDFVEDYTVRELIARIQFKTAAADTPLRPTVDLGIGLRNYDFDGIEENCDNLTFTKQESFICNQADALTADQTVPMFLFGLGMEYSTSRINPFVRLHLQVAPYGGDAQGQKISQQELLGSAGFSINVF